MFDITTVSSSLIATPAFRRGFTRRGGALSAVAVALRRPLPAGAMSFGA